METSVKKKWTWKYRIAVRMRSAVSCSKLDVSLEHKLLVVSVQFFLRFWWFCNACGCDFRYTHCCHRFLPEKICNFAVYLLLDSVIVPD